MNKIIALREIGNSGKTTTIRRLHTLMIADGYSVIHTTFGPQFRQDFITVYERNGKIVGITSSGDTEDLVLEKLRQLIDAGCVICVCACRSYGGTNKVVKNYPGFDYEFVEKTYDPNNQDGTNAADAQKLLDKINGLVLTPVAMAV